MMAKGMSALRLVGALCGLLWLAAPGAGRAEATSLPNGADSIQEGYQDWRLLCRSHGDAGQKTAVRCVMTQQAVEARSRRRVLALRMEPDGEQVRGVAVVPFGLDLARGVSLTNARQPVGDVYSFSTCLPTGCLVPLSFDDRQWSTLLAEPTATLTATSLSGEPMKMVLSTRGLTAALQRARSLMQ